MDLVVRRDSTFHNQCSIYKIALNVDGLIDDTADDDDDGDDDDDDDGYDEGQQDNVRARPMTSLTLTSGHCFRFHLRTRGGSTRTLLRSGLAQIA